MALIIVEFLQDPGRSLRATIGKGNSIDIIFNNRLGFRGSLPCRGRVWTFPTNGSWRWFSRCNIARLVGLLILLLSLCGRRYRLRKIFLEQRLKSNDYEKSKGEDEKQSPFSAGVLLRI